MFTQFYIEKTDENGTKYDIRISLIDKKLVLDDIGVKEKRKRNFKYLGSRVSDDYSYRSLDTEGRREYKNKVLLSNCPVELINEALEEAWLQLKPNLFSE